MLVDEVDEQPPTLATFTNLFGAAAAISTEETGAQLDNAAMVKRLLEVINKLCEEHARLQAENERMKVHLDKLVRHRRFPCRLLRCRPHRHLLRHHLLHRRRPTYSLATTFNWGSTSTCSTTLCTASPLAVTMRAPGRVTGLCSCR